MLGAGNGCRMPENCSEVRDSRGRESAGAAFFDVDGTLVSTHIVHQYLFIRKTLANRHGGALSAALYSVWLAAFYVRCLTYLYLDRVSRTRMNIVFYRNYRGLVGEHVRGAVDACFEQVLLPHLYPQAERCIRDHLQAGRRVVLVTGSIDFIISPLVRHFANHGRGARVDLIARTLVDEGGRLTGDLDGPPIGEEEKARAIERYVRSEKIDLSASYAYGDSIADLPMLELVGHPNVVNADRALAKNAGARGWPCHSWQHAGSGT